MLYFPLTLNDSDLCGIVTCTAPSLMFDCSYRCLYNIMTHAISHMGTNAKMYHMAKV